MDYYIPRKILKHDNKYFDFQYNINLISKGIKSEKIIRKKKSIYSTKINLPFPAIKLKLIPNNIRSKIEKNQIIFYHSIKEFYVLNILKKVLKIFNNGIKVNTIKVEDPFNQINKYNIDISYFLVLSFILLDHNTDEYLEKSLKTINFNTKNFFKYIKCYYPLIIKISEIYDYPNKEISKIHFVYYYLDFNEELQKYLHIFHNEYIYEFFVKRKKLPKNCDFDIITKKLIYDLFSDEKLFLEKSDISSSYPNNNHRRFYINEEIFEINQRKLFDDYPNYNKHYSISFLSDLIDNNTLVKIDKHIYKYTENDEEIIYNIRNSAFTLPYYEDTKVLVNYKMIPIGKGFSSFTNLDNEQYYFINNGKFLCYEKPFILKKFKKCEIFLDGNIFEKIASLSDIYLRKAIITYSMYTDNNFKKNIKRFIASKNFSSRLINSQISINLDNGLEYLSKYILNKYFETKNTNVELNQIILKYISKSNINEFMKNDILQVKNFFINKGRLEIDEDINWDIIESLLKNRNIVIDKKWIKIYKLNKKIETMKI